ANIIKYCARPFSSVDEMNSELIRRWNAVVSPDDEVWHLGDFSFYRGADFLSALHGHKLLVAGNHDRAETRKNPGWEKVFTGHTYLDGYMLKHIPEPNFKARGLLHGHTHSPPDKRRHGNVIDVGVDAWDYTPRTLEELLQG